ncbi:ATP-grasp domain-containing protein [Virgibacillus sp. DJP39]|uniref:ATP-grasp domain-containing protein n=1 Tax=Virgibacillus sp. DJP39 TaxID=3409790 RepID=UPI003BB7E45E
MKQNKLFLVGVHKTHTAKAIERAKMMGFQIVVGDKKESLEKHKGLVKDAHRLVYVDYNNFEDLLSTTLRLVESELINTIFSFNEYALYNVARVQENIGISGNSSESINICDDKYKTKKTLSESGLHINNFAICDSEFSVENFIKEYGLPVVLKPTKQKASIGVIEIKSESQIKQAFKECKELCNPNDKILVEEYIKGREVSIEAIVYKGTVYVWGITEKLIYSNTFVESGHITPYKHGDLDSGFFNNITEKIVNSIGVKMGPLHIEGFIHDNNFIVGEVHTRYGGDNISLITECSIRSDMHSPIFAEIGDINYRIKINSPDSFYGVNYIHAKPGIIESVRGHEDLNELKNLIEYKLTCDVGDKVNPLRNSYDRLGWFLVRANSRNEILETMETIQKQVKIKTAKN